MSSRDRFPWDTATSLTQSLLNFSHDNLTCRLEVGVDITAPDGSIIRASDRNKYIGEHFYEALTNFPQINKTVGEWLGGGLEFPELTLEISNADGRFNKFLPSGADFAGWIGRAVELKIGLAENAATYFPIFKGFISEVGGFGRSVKSITIKARDSKETVNRLFPTEYFDDVTYNKASDQLWGKRIPYVLGDWTVNVVPGAASVPAFVTNGLDPIVNGKDFNVTFAAGSPATFTFNNHRLNVGDKIEISNSSGGGVADGGPRTVSAVAVNQFQLTGVNASSSGTATVKKHSSQAYRPVTNTISTNNLSFLGTVFLLRQDKYYIIPDSQITVGSGNKTLEIAQDSSSFQIEGANWVFDTSDTFWVLCKGKSLSGFDENPVWQARDLLMVYGGLLSGDFDSTWTTYRDATPHKSRVWIQEQQPCMEYALSILEQVRLEPFVNRSLQFELNSLRFEDWNTSPSFKISNWDVQKDTFKPVIDDRNNFNQATGAYGFLPNTNENGFVSRSYRNVAAISQAGKVIAKVVVFPNLHVRSEVEEQLTEILKLASGYREIVEMQVTFRSLLVDVGDFVSVDVQIGSTVFDNVPCMVRGLAYVPETLNISFRLWSFAMLPFGTYVPGYAGTVGGQSAVITLA